MSSSLKETILSSLFSPNATFIYGGRLTIHIDYGQNIYKARTLATAAATCHGNQPCLYTNQYGRPASFVRPLRSRSAISNDNWGTQIISLVTSGPRYLGLN